MAEGARARGASKIIGIDINPDKFQLGIIIAYEKKKEKKKNMHVHLKVNENCSLKYCLDEQAEK